MNRQVCNFAYRRFVVKCPFLAGRSGYAQHHDLRSILHFLTFMVLSGLNFQIFNEIGV